MPRQLRLHVSGAYYYILLRSGGAVPLLSEAPEYFEFEHTVRTSLHYYGVQAIAYCWTPRAAHLAVRVGDVRVGRFVQRVASMHGRWINRRRRGLSYGLAQSHRALLIDADIWLLPLVRHIHWLPVLEGRAGTLDEYRWSSHAAYLGLRRVPWLTTRIVLRRLSRDTARARRRYSALLQVRPPREDIARFSEWRGPDRRVLGDAAFVAGLARPSARIRPAMELEHVIDAVASLLRIEGNELASRSRSRLLVLGRALVTVHATRQGGTTLSVVARRLGRHPSSLIAAVRRHRSRRPELFRAGALGTPSARAASARVGSATRVEQGGRAAR